jgi:Zn-dependent peptidase ImmA (M78 family)/DNA-binding XRE family transcriptional regulator
VERTVNPSRLELARRRRGVSMRRLAELIGVEPRTISAYEKGEFSPSSDTLARLASKLRFPIEFFHGADLDMPRTRVASFRALSRMTAAERDSALGAGALALLLHDWIDKKFELPACDLPDLQGEEPEAAAEAIRGAWGLGYSPIKNMIHLVESRGVRVFSLAEDTKRVDAFSFWRAETPFVFLNTAKSAERSRFDCAHELGHLVLHKHGGPQGQGIEEQANAFASAFLMPASSVWSTVRETPSVAQLVQLKKRWTVSVAALMYRLWKLGILSDWQYRSMCIEIADYRKSEPEPAPRETSQVLAKVFDALRRSGSAKSDIARELAIQVEQLEELIFGLVVAADGAVQPKRSSRANLHLRVVK